MLTRAAAPGCEHLARVREGEVVVRDLSGREPAELGDVVVRLGRSLNDAGCPIEVERGRRRAVAAVAIHPHPEKLKGLDLYARLLAQLAAHAISGMLLFVEEPARQIPLAGERIDPPPGEQDASLVVEAHRARGRLRACVDTEPALWTLDHPAGGLHPGSTARTVLPLIELAHVRNNRPRATLRHSDRHRARAHRALPGAPRGGAGQARAQHASGRRGPG